VAVHKGILLLPCLALLALAQVARGDEALGAEAPVRASAKQRPAPPQPRGPVDPMPGMRRDTEVVPAAFIAQHPIPNEPLGFSQSKFNPTSGPIVDPSISGETTYADFGGEFYDSGYPDGEAPAVSSGEWIRNGCWYADVAATYFNRSAAVKNRVPLSFELISQVDLNLNRLVSENNLGYQPGIDFTLGRYLGRDVRNRDHSVEFTFLGLNHWQTGKSITAEQPGSIFLFLDFQATVPVYEGSNFQSIDQTSDFNSYELNYRVDRRLGRDRMVYSRDNTWVREATSNWVCSFISGIRTAIVNERMYWFAQNSLGTGNYTVVTHNNMVGPQVAGELFYDHAYWRLGVRAKTGALVNFSSQSSTVRILDNNGNPLSPNRDEYAKDHSMSFVGGLSFIGEYRFRPNFGLKGSFDMLWLTDLALAQNQLTFFPSTPAQLSNSHSLFLNGFMIGFEWYR
jgi:hypothetical protein